MATHIFQTYISFNTSEYDTAPEDAAVLLVAERLPSQFDASAIDVLRVTEYKDGDVDVLVEVTVDGPLDTTNLVEKFGEE